MSSSVGDLAIVVTSYLLPGWMRSRWWGWNSQSGDLIVIAHAIMLFAIGKLRLIAAKYR